jgi:hypothetical protein
LEVNSSLSMHAFSGKNLRAKKRAKKADFPCKNGNFSFTKS